MLAIASLDDSLKIIGDLFPDYATIILRFWTFVYRKDW